MKIVIRKTRIESFVLMFFLLLPIFREFIFSHIPMGYYFMDAILILSIAFCAFSNKRKAEYYDLIIVYGLVLLLFIFKFLADSSMAVWLTRDYGVRHMFIVCGIFGYGVIRIQRDYDQMLKSMKICGIVLGIYYLYQSLEVLRNGYWSYYQFGQYWKTSSNMAWSYGVLLSICFLSIFVLINKKIVFLVPMAIGLLGIMVYGSRGTVVAFALGVLLTVLFVNEGKLKIRNYILIGLLVVLVVFLFSDTGLAIINTWFNSHGLSSRFLTLLTFQQTFEAASNGRARIWTKVIEMIKTGPIWGYGVFGERNEVYSLGYKWGYSHNIALEILVSFGWLVGGLIIIAIVIGIIRFFKSSKNKKERLVFVIFLTVTFELMVSNSIWLHYGFWCLLGLYVNHFKRNRFAEEISL